MEKNREQLIQTIRDRNEITAVVAEYVTLKKSGKTLSGLCPFHHEKTPSFTVSREKQLFYCFGCSSGGDVFNFIMRIENLTFPQAARWLAERAQIPWEEEETPDASRRRKEREAIYKLNSLASEFYHQVLLNAPQANTARDYLQSRGLGSEAIQEFRLGYALPIWEGLANMLKKKGIPMALAERAGLVLSGQNGFYDRFRDRVIFPILDPQGRVAAFGGRVLGNGQPKYLNSPDTPIFNKGRYLYGLFQAKDHIRSVGKAVIVEGYTDVIQAHIQGIKEVVASLGTALTLDQIKTLRRYTEDVTIAYDADTAGQSATVRGLDLVRHSGLMVRVARLPEGDDPDSLLRRGEAEKFRRILHEGVDLFQFKLEHALSDQNLTSPEGKARAVAATMPLLAEVDNRVARDEYLRLLAQRLHVNEETLYLEWRNYQSRLRKKHHSLDISSEKRDTRIDQPKAGTRLDSQENQTADPSVSWERELLRGALQEIKNLRRIKEALSQQDLVNPVYREILGFLFSKELTDLNWPPNANEVPDGRREDYIALLAENEAKQYSVDVEGCCVRLKQMSVLREIQRVQEELAAGSELGGSDLSERLNRLNELNKTLRRDYPTFSGLI